MKSEVFFTKLQMKKHRDNLCDISYLYFPKDLGKTFLFVKGFTIEQN